MKWLCIVLVMMLLLGCSVKQKVTSSEVDYKRIASELREMVRAYERRTEVYRDSLVTVRGLLEKSSNVSDSISHLETSYARSDAEIKGGRLYHSIENKDSVPGQIKYVSVDVERHDTIYRERIDTVYVERMKVVEKTVEKKRFMCSFFYTSGWLAWVVLLGGGIWFLYKVKKDER